MPHSPTQETFYRLVYRADAVIPIELSKPSSRIITMMEESNEDARSVELDMVKEEREKARIKKEAIKWRGNTTRRSTHKNLRRKI